MSGPFEPPPSAAELAKIRKAYADGPYGQIHFRALRPADLKRPPLICFHTSPVSSVVYDYFLVEMGRDRWSIAPDTPGYGDSAPPPQPDDWECAMPTVEIKDYVKAMVALADSLGIEKFDVMGYHTGSCVALETARVLPDRVGKLVMWTVPLFKPEEVLAHQKIWFTPPAPPSYSEFLLQRIKAFGDRTKMFPDEPNEERDAEIVIDWIRGYPREHWGHNSVMIYASEIAKNLAQIKQPMLVINAMEDDIPEVTKRVVPTVEKNKRSRYVERAWDHGALDGHVREMATMVRDFLDNA